MKVEILFCTKCKTVNCLNGKFSVCKCPSEFLRMDIFDFPINKTVWGRFMDCLIDIDIPFLMGAIGLLIMNNILLLHTDLSLIEKMLEGGGLGLLIPRLLKYK